MSATTPETASHTTEAEARVSDDGTRTLYDGCPLCTATEIESLREASCASHPLWAPGLPERMRWMSCRSCGHVFTEGHYQPEALAKLLEKTNPHQEPGGDAQAGRAASARIVGAAVDLAGGKLGRWLDVGFGSGALLATAAEFGFEAAGIDLRGSVVEKIKELGYAAFQTELPRISDDGMFDVISLADVLEHIPFPGDAMLQVRRLLRDDGLLFVSSPNSDTLVWRTLDAADRNPYWAEIEHYHNFDRARLYALLGVWSFAPVRYGVSERYVSGMEVFARKTPENDS